MHARIDQKKCVIPTKYSNRYQLENSSRRINRRNELETAPIEEPWPLDWNGLMSYIRSGLWGTGFGPLGGLRTSWDTGCAPDDSNDEINCYRVQNDRIAKCGIGSEGFPRICPDALCPLISSWTKKKAIKNKRKEWAWKKCIQDRYSSPSTKAPTGNTFASLALTAPTCLDIPWPHHPLTWFWWGFS